MEQKGMKLIPVYDLQAVLNSWKYYVPGLEKVLDNSGLDTSLEKIYNDIMAGKLLLWVGFVDGIYAGFVTTAFHTVYPDRKFLWIVHCYKKTKVSTSFLLMGLRQIEQFARKNNCQFVKFYAKEKPWQDKLKLLGYEPGYVEYIKSLGEDEDEDLPENSNQD